MANNLADQYSASYSKVKYGDGYLIGIHGVQSALNLMGYGSAENVNLNSIRYGYDCVNTEGMITQFQKDNGLNITGVLNEKTWDTIFSTLLAQKQCVIMITGEEEVSIVDIDAYLEALNALTASVNTSTSGETLSSGSMYEVSKSGKTFTKGSTKTNSDSLSTSTDGNKTHSNISTLNPGMTNIDWYDPSTLLGKKTLNSLGGYVTDGGVIYDDLMYNYVTRGGKYYNGVSYSYNLNGSDSTSDSRGNSTTAYAGESNKDYDFIYNLLSNSVYGDGGYYNASRESKSSVSTLKAYGGSFEDSNNKPFFSPNNIAALRKSKFDITIVYGAKGESARKIRQVTPMSVSQEMNASGEPIYDVYEFVARDVSYGV